jgi:hypothetical protein
MQGQWCFGRYHEAIADPSFGVRGLRRWRQKEWHYSAFTTERWFVAFGVVQLGYAANAFAYVVDRERPEDAHELEVVSPLGRAVRFAPSSVGGSTRFRHGPHRLEVTWRGNGWDVDLDLRVGARHLRGQARTEDGEALALLHPLGPDRPAYTHKAAALRTGGRLMLDDEPIDLTQGLGSLDWTRSMALRETRWKWASFSSHDSAGRPLGLNLSAEVYDDAEGHSRENAYWSDGAVHPLEGVKFQVPARPAQQEWRIHSLRGDAVSLRFRPQGARAQRLNLGLLRSDFVQPYGVFDGVVAGHEVANAFGVVEVHRSVW